MQAKVCREAEGRDRWIERYREKMLAYRTGLTQINVHMYAESTHHPFDKAITKIKLFARYTQCYQNRSIGREKKNFLFFHHISMNEENDIMGLHTQQTQTNEVERHKPLNS